MKMIYGLIITVVLDFRSHALPTGCQSNEWQCTDGTCISRSERCDNFPDCTDGSDELQCTVSPVCLEGLESCPQPNGTTICVKKAIGCNCGPVNDIANGKIRSDNITIGSVATVVCDTGYDATLPTVTCQVTGLWETVSCIPKDCGPTPSILFGNVTLTDDRNSTFGATAKVTCDSGYLEKKHFIICESSGVWENAACLPIDCGPVLSIAFGTIVLSDSNNTTFGASAVVTCDAGYKTKTSQVLCLKSGMWETAECTIQGCGFVPAISHGIIIAPANDSVRSFASVVCDKGYEANVSSIFCKISGQWESASCAIKDCGQTPAIPFGQIIPNDITTYGSSASVTCYTGYTSNVSEVLCQSSGVWEESVCKPIDCGFAPSISFGNITLSDNKNSTFGATAEVTCNSGYLEKKHLIICQSSGVWENAACLPIDCGQVQSIAFGTIILGDINNTKFGASAVVTCDAGYKTNTSEVLCLKSGLWETAECTMRDCGQTPAIPFGQITPNGFTTYGSSANVTCYTGYTSNVSKVYCQSTGIWEESVCKPIVSSACIKRKSGCVWDFNAPMDNLAYKSNALDLFPQLPPCLGCGSLPKISHGTIRTSANASVGSFASVTCDTGYEANVSSVMCRSAGHWETAICTVTDCGQSPVIPYGQSSPIDYRNTTYGASARVICQTGYESSVSIILCQSTGVWQAAVCRPKDCGNPPTIASGNTSLNSDRNTTFGAMAYVTCDYNFVTDTPVITCQSTGKWENAICSHKGCRSLTAINNGVITAVGKAAVGSYATVTCHKGYEPSSPEVMCKMSGIWETASCKPKGCRSLTAINNGVITAVGKAAVGSYAKVTCHKGYEPSSPEVMCKMSGIWETASCKPKDCGPTPLIANGKITLVFSNKSTYKEEAFVTCDANYFASVSRITCQSTGVWEAASCIFESKLSYDMCTKEHGTCTQYVYEYVRVRGLKSSKCKTFCQCAHASTLPTGNVTYKWVEHNCPPDT